MASIADRMDELEDLRCALIEVEEALDAAMSAAHDAARLADRMETHTGDTELIAPQLESYLIPTLQAFIDSEHQTSSMSSLFEIIEDADCELVQDEEAAAWERKTEHENQ